MAAPRSWPVVCLGGGNSSGYLARYLLACDLPGSDLAIITDEQVVAYERPALSKAYLFPKDPARLPGFHTCVGGGGERQDPEFYKQHGITYLTGTKVVAADVAGKTLTLASGDKVCWTKALVVATGADAVRLSDFKTPGAELAGVHYLRSVADADALLAGLAAAKAAPGGGKVVVVGGGYIGLEVAAGVSLHGVDVDMVFPEDRLMARLFTPQLAAFYEAFYQAKGITLRKGLLAKELRGDDAGQVSSVVLSDGTELPANLVVVGAGARPASSLFKGQLELDATGGILVDSSFKTSAPDVFAIGDVASFKLATGGSPVRQEHVTHARKSAAHAARAIIGANVGEYNYTPFFYSREFNLSWQCWGQTSTAPDEVAVWGDASPAAAAAAAGGATAHFGAFFVNAGKVVGAFAEGASAAEASALGQVVAARVAAPALDALRDQGAAWAVEASSKL